MQVYSNYYFKNFIMTWKFFSSLKIFFKKIVLLNIRMTSLSLNELKLTAQNRNISNSKEDLIKALREM